MFNNSYYLNNCLKYKFHLSKYGLYSYTVYKFYILVISELKKKN